MNTEEKTYAIYSRKSKYTGVGESIQNQIDSSKRLLLAKYPSVDEKQTIGLMCDEITTDSEGHRHYSLTLLHAQNGVPEYYSAELFLSIADYRLPEKPAEGDIITITINTYKGKTERSFQY